MKMQSVHTFLTWPWASLCLAAQVACLAFSANAAPAQTLTAAIYFQHVGPSDKPIFPVVICAAKPAAVELTETLGDEAQFASIVVISAQDLRGVLAGVTGKVTAAKEAGKQNQLGSFRVSVTQALTDPGRVLPANTDRLVRVVGREAMPAVFSSLEKAGAYSAPNSQLKSALVAVKARTGLKEAK